MEETGEISTFQLNFVTSSKWPLGFLPHSSYVQTLLYVRKGTCRQWNAAGKDCHFIRETSDWGSFG